MEKNQFLNKKKILVRKIDSYVNFKMRDMKKYLDEVTKKRLRMAFIFCFIILFNIIGFFSFEYYLKEQETQKKILNGQIDILKENLSSYIKAMQIIGIGGYEQQELIEEAESNDIGEGRFKKLLKKYNLLRYTRRYEDYGYPVRCPELSIIPIASCEFGWRRWGRSKQFHTGSDIVSLKDYDILSVGSGEVIYVGYSKIYGMAIKIQHGENYRSFYAHCNDMYVKEGDKILKGQLIATLGNSGDPRYCKGYHLHFGWQVKEGKRWRSYNYFRNALHRKRYYLKK